MFERLGQVRLPNNACKAWGESASSILAAQFYKVFVKGEKEFNLCPSLNWGFSFESVYLRLNESRNVQGVRRRVCLRRCWG